MSDTTRPPSGRVIRIVANQVYVSARRSTVLATLRPPLKASDLFIGGEVGLEWFRDRAYVVSVIARRAASPQFVPAPSGLRAQGGALCWDWDETGTRLGYFEVDCCHSLDHSVPPYPLRVGADHHHLPVISGSVRFRVRAVSEYLGPSPWTAWSDTLNAVVGSGVVNLGSTTTVLSSSTIIRAGPDITVSTVSAVTTVARKGNGVLLKSGSGALLGEYTTASLAIAAAAAGDIVELPAGTNTETIVQVASTTLRGSGRKATILTGQVTGASSSILEDLSVIRTASDATKLIGFLSASSGDSYINDCEIVVTQSGAGTGYGISVQAGNVYMQGGRLVGSTAQTDEVEILG